MARKTPSFGQLINYMSDIKKSDEKHIIHQNLYSKQTDQIEQEYLKNATYIPKRKNGNYMYHEILSINKAQKLETEKQKEILRSIAYHYIQKRAPTNLVFGTLHDDHSEHLHYHLLISANSSGESKKTRLSKIQFDKIKKQTEIWVLKNYPELEQKKLLNKEEERQNTKTETQKQKKPERNKSSKANIKIKVQEILNQCKSKQEFFTALKEAKLEYYLRGNTPGVKDLETQKKHRLKTMGILEEFQNLPETQKPETNKEEFETAKEEIQSQEEKHQTEIQEIRKNQKNSTHSHSQNQ